MLLGFSFEFAIFQASALTGRADLGIKSCNEFENLRLVGWDLQGCGQVCQLRTLGRESSSKGCAMASGTHGG